MSNGPNGLYEFGPYRLDAAKRLLTRSGESIALAPKTFDLLLLLIRCEGRVLTKIELMTALWPDTIVEEASISYQVATLRKALDSDGEACVETVPKHGYRFVAPITTIPRDQEPADGNSPPMRKSLRRVQPRQVLPWLVASAAVFFAVAFALLYFRQLGRSVPAQGLARFFVSPPEKIVLSDRGLPAISPDGQQLAFGGVDANGTNRIWVRPIASLTAEPIPGTEGVNSLFWSADSRSLGFFAGGKLKTVQINGGPPRALCDASEALRPMGTWSPGGVILFNSFDRHGLYRVAASGGQATPVTTLNPARQELAHLWPQFLPDGRHFIYLVQSRRLDVTGIYAGSLDSKESRLILRTSSLAAYVGMDRGISYLLFMRGATLMAQSFDDNRLELKGEPFPIAEQVWLPPSPARGFAAFSASGNGVLAYRSLPEAITELAWFDRRGNRLGRVGSPANYSVVALSPNERKLALTRVNPAVGTRDLWLLDMASGMPLRFTFDPSEETNPTWSPDGQWIAFSSNRMGIIGLYEKAVNGIGEFKPLIETPENKLIESWSPDGRFILYEAVGDVWALPLTGDRKPISLFPMRGESRINLSPNGRWAAYQSNESGREEIYVQSFPAGGGKWQVSPAGGEEPYWRHDGKEIFFISGKMLTSVDVNSDEPAFRYGKPTPLFEVRLEVEGRRSRYQVSGDGQRFLVNLPLESMQSAPITVVTNWAAGLKK